jgi:hypothetical protein
VSSGTKWRKPNFLLESVKFLVQKVTAGYNVCVALKLMEGTGPSRYGCGAGFVPMLMNSNDLQLT